tara:strand:+ start:4906 stop:8667 length:3762 start_codon:yes stop_codon:yes gene_type:complete
MAYQQEEKRNTSFKHVSNIQHTKGDRSAADEPFESRHPIFSNNLISEKPGISQDQTLDDKILRTRTWTPVAELADGTFIGSNSGTQAQRLEALYSGSFVSTYKNAGGATTPGERPEDDGNYSNEFRYVEKVIVPLIMENNSAKQFFIAMDWSNTRDGVGDTSQDANSDLLGTSYTNSPGGYPIKTFPAHIIQRDGDRLKNWLYQQGFGSDYAETVFESNTARSSFNNSAAGKVPLTGVQDEDTEAIYYGGRVFDPAAGTIQIGLNDADEVHLYKEDGSALKLPLWLVGYRYVGPTGAAAASTDGSSASGAASSPGIITTLFSSSGSKSQRDNEYGYYEKTTLTPTDSNDVLEYVQLDDLLIVSSSIGERDYLIRLGSASLYDVSGSFTGPVRYYGANYVKSETKIDLTGMPVDIDGITGGSDTTETKIVLRSFATTSGISTYGPDQLHTGEVGSMFDANTSTAAVFDPDTDVISLDILFADPFPASPSGETSLARNLYKIAVNNGPTANAAMGVSVQISASNDATYSFHMYSSNTVTSDHAQNWLPITSFDMPQDQTTVHEFDSGNEYKYYRIKFKSDSDVGPPPNDRFQIKTLQLYDQVNTATKYADAGAVSTQVNGGDIFAYTPDGYADLSSFGYFDVPSYAQSTTHSFHFSEAKRLDTIGLYYSHITASAPTSDDPLPFIDGITLWASHDNVTFNAIASASNMATNTANGVITSSFYKLGGPYMPDNEGVLASIGQNRDTGDRGYYISYVTASIATASKYAYYKLEVSGALFADDRSDTAQYLHHLDLYENKYYGPTNRKQINIGLNQTGTGDTGPFGQDLSIFDKAVSASAARLGMFSGSVIASGFTTFQGADLTNDLNLGYNFAIQSALSMTASRMSASHMNTEFIESTQITSSIISSSTLLGSTINGIDVYASSSLQLPSLTPIYFTNYKQDGSRGVDEFSGRMFGYYTPAGVSEIYVDAYRIYNVADAKADIRVLHPTSGSISLTANSIIMSGSVIVGSDGANIPIGIISASNGSNGITGSATATFLTEFNEGDAIRIQSASFFRTYVIASIVDNNHLRLSDPWEGGTWSGSRAYKDPDLFTVKNSAGITEFKIGKSGNISASADITASSIFLSEGSQLNVGTGTNRSSVRSNQISAPTVIASSAQGLTTTAITASGDISSSGTIIASNLSGTNTGDQSLVHLAVTSSNVLFGNVTASNNVSASGTIIGSNLSGTNTGDQDLSSYIQNSQTASFVTTTTVIDGGTF